MFRKLVAAALLAVPAIAQADWYEASTGHFIVYSEQKPDKLKEFAIRLERFDKMVRALRQAKDEPIDRANRLNVYVVDDTDVVAKLAGDRGVAGFYRPRAGGSLAIVPRGALDDSSEGDLGAQEILLHEYAHHLMWSLSPNVAFPSWYIEGAAEAFATTKYEKDGSMLLGSPPQYRGYGLLTGNWLSAGKLLTADTLKLDDQQRDALYGRGWLLYHYLQFSGQRKGQLIDYLVAINSGKSLQEAAKVFGDLKVLDRELERYKRGHFSGLRLDASKTAAGEVTIRKLTDGEAATMDVRIRSKNGVSEKTAPGVYAAAKRAAAPYPNDVGAQLVLAEAAYDAGDYATSEAAADRAIAADPKAVDGHVYKAMCQIALATKAKDYGKERWTAIRRIIATGNRANPQDPEPLILYYTSFIAQGIPPSDIAKDGLDSAFDFAPYDSDLRFNLAAMFLRERRADVARALLAPLAYSPHGKGMALLAATLVDKIDAKDIDGAITLLDSGRSKSGMEDETG